MQLPRYLQVLILISMFLCTVMSSSSDNITKDFTFHSNSRIYKGQDAPKNKYPFYVDLFIKFDNAKDPNGNRMNKHGSGVLISKRHILTCAHNFYPFKGKDGRDTYWGKAFAGGLVGGWKAYKNGTSNLENVDFHYSDVTLYPDNKSPGENKIIISFL